MESREGTYYDPAARRAVALTELEFVEEVCGNRGTLLDFGCGDGAFARVAQDAGWQVSGFDPAAPVVTDGALSLSRERPTGLFDAVTMWDVIEHVRDPLAALREARESLSPGGWLFVETNNFFSTSRIVGGPSWWAYHWDHRWYFAPSTLQRLLKTAGFSTVRLCPKTLRPWIKEGAAYAGPKLTSYIKRCAKSPRAIRASIAEWRELSTLHDTYGDTAGLKIFTMAAQA